MSFQFRNFEEARAAFAMDQSIADELGIAFPNAISYIPDSWRRNYQLAMDELIGAAREQGYALDALPGLQTDPNAGIPAWFTMVVDPQVYRILFAPVKMAEILGEVRKGTWLDQTAMFPVVEHVGEVQTYGDNSEGGNAGVNTNFPQRQSYKFQTVIRYGEEELERAGLAKINYVSELGVSAANVQNRYLNFTYAYGISGLQCYGMLNDPHLPASISPGTKAANTGASPSGSNAWYYNGAINATANEVYADIQLLYNALVSASAGLVDENTKLILALGPGPYTAFKTTNSFNVNVETLLKSNFPNLEIKTAVQYSAQSSSNPEGIAAGNLVQMIAPEIEGMKQGYVAYNEKLRSFPIVRGLSNYKQKQMSGTWGAIWRSTLGVQQMIGV